MAAPGPRAGRGQASTEYLVVLVFMVVVLIVATLDPSPVAALAAAIKTFFAAYSYAISLTS
jgi:Flp pilus assembly pilin Flp